MNRWWHSNVLAHPFDPFSIEFGFVTRKQLFHVARLAGIAVAALGLFACQEREGGAPGPSVLAKSDQAICHLAISVEVRMPRWDDRPAMQEYVNEAARRGYSPTSCVKLLQENLSASVSGVGSPAGPYDGDWKGQMDCATCSDCSGPLQIPVTIVVTDYEFKFVPDRHYVGVGAISDQGHVKVRWAPVWPYLRTTKPKNLWFDGQVSGGQLELSGERGSRTCQITLKRST
jgi:hypothetical protein